MSGVSPSSEPARRILRGLQRHFAEALGLGSLSEVTLGNGRRVDFMSIDRKGRIWVMEVKSSPQDFRSDRKWPEYQDYCDFFAFAVAPEFPQELLPSDVGLYLSDGFTAESVRQPQETPLSSARRKAVTLLYARTAAARLVQRETAGLTQLIEF
jgi:hypothetical protein